MAAARLRQSDLSLILFHFAAAKSYFNTCPLTSFNNHKMPERKALYPHDKAFNSGIFLTCFKKFFVKYTAKWGVQITGMIFQTG